MIAVLRVVIAGSQLPSNLIMWRITPGPVLITVIWAVGLLLQRAGGLPSLARVRRP